MSTIDVNQDNRTCGHRQDELVVAIPHRGIVQDCLSIQFQLTSHVLKVNRVLDLAVLKIDNLVDQAPSLWNKVAEPPDTGEPPGYPRPAEATSYPLDAVLYLVRGYFAKKYAKWTPTVAKNYEMRTVTGLPHIDGLSGLAAAFPDPKVTEKPAWAAPYLGRGVKIGVIDTALYPCGPLLEHYTGAAQLALLPYPTDGNLVHWAGHGLFCAGLILRQAGGVELYSGPALESDSATTTSWNLAEWMLDARNAGVEVLNVSAGCTTWDGQAPLVLERAIDVLWPDMVIVAAAGNHGNVSIDAAKLNPREPMTSESAIWPAASSRIVSVGSYETRSGGQKFLADFNPHVSWQMFVAPGVDVVSTYLEGEVRIDDPAKRATGPVQTKDFEGLATWSGSSFATATVTGAIAARMTGGVSAHEAVGRLLADGQDGIDGIWTYEKVKNGFPS